MSAPPGGAELADHHHELRETLRAYLERHAPAALVHRLDAEARYPVEIVAGLAELGICGATIARCHGGTEADAVSVAIVCEELQRAGGTIAAALVPTLALCAPAVQAHGTDAQREQLLPEIAAGRMRIATGLAEEDSGVALRAEPDGDGLLVTGTTAWCTGAQEAQYVLAVVRTEPGSTGRDGLSLVLLPTDADGVDLHPVPTLAAQGTATCEVRADRVRVGPEHLVGGRDGAERVLRSLRDRERIAVAAQCVGVAHGAYDAALAFASERRRAGRPLAEMACQLAMIRPLAYGAAARADRGGHGALEAAMAKVACSERATAIVGLGMEVLGASAGAVGHPMERFWREVKLLELAGGPNDLLRDEIAERLAPAGTPAA